jgi:hypothetical protein
MICGKLAGNLLRTIDADHAMSPLKQALSHITAHFSQTNHCKFHVCFSQDFSIFAFYFILKLQFLSVD